jgi:hypothetical protein
MSDNLFARRAVLAKSCSFAPLCILTGREGPKLMHDLQRRGNAETRSKRQK